MTEPSTTTAAPSTGSRPVPSISSAWVKSVMPAMEASCSALPGRQRDVGILAIAEDGGDGAA